VWPCIVTNVFIIKPTRCNNFTNLFWHETTCFRQFLCPSSGVHSLYTQQWLMSYRFVDSFWVGPFGPAQKLSRNLYDIRLLNVQWMNAWWWTEELSETCRVPCQNKFVKLVYLVGFIIKETGCHVCIVVIIQMMIVWETCQNISVRFLLLINWVTTWTKFRHPENGCVVLLWNVRTNMPHNIWIKKTITEENVMFMTKGAEFW